ncbi:MAG: phosphoglycerate dehydrogenase [Oscillospiraceae bacterium]|nr:phosphoglycerate dehydrogenase [Oscillospiraceae bacterium]
MYRVKTMNKIAEVGLKELPKDSFEVSNDFDHYDAVLVRSASLHDVAFPEELRVIARAGAGVNNIPIDKCSENGIVVFNTPGANANAVKELVLAALLYSSRDIFGGSQWVNNRVLEGVDVTTVVEKGKSAFIGPEIKGKTLGIVGLGAIGAKVANAAIALGMKVIGYDPYLTVNTALLLDHHVRHTAELDDIYREADYITLHVPFNKNTAGMINGEALSKMKDGVRILNFARGGLVNDEDMIAALEAGKVSRYVTDFPTNALAKTRNVVCTPHLGASTPESEDNCAVMAAQELRDYLENGNIANSVNLPAVSMPRSGVCRVTIMHRNVHSVLANIIAIFAKLGINVENLVNKSRGEYAYTMVDLNTVVGDEVRAELNAMDTVIRVRIL